jgi:hypothetical protein
VVGIFENDKWSGRLAYNWRGEFLTSTFDAAGPNPQYVEPYGQLDLSLGYNITREAQPAVRGDQPDQRNDPQPRPRQGNGGVRDPDRRALHGGRTLQVLIVPGDAETAGVFPAVFFSAICF